MQALSSSPVAARTVVRPASRPASRRPMFATRAEPAKAPEHFEPADLPRGECLLQDARDAMDACKGLPPAEEAACMLQFGCDAGAVHARLDAEEEAEADKKAKEAGKAAAA